MKPLVIGGLALAVSLATVGIWGTVGLIVLVLLVLYVVGSLLP